MPDDIMNHSNAAVCNVELSLSIKKSKLTKLASVHLGQCYLTEQSLLVYCKPQPHCRVPIKAELSCTVLKIIKMLCIAHLFPDTVQAHYQS